MNRRLRDEIERDLREHIEMETRENMERGMAPGEARAAALRKFGNVARIAEETRAVWQWAWFERLAQDVRYALRGLRRNPIFAAAAILTLALAIGMNTAVFSVVSGVLLKPLPYRGGERIVWVTNVNRQWHTEIATAPDFIDWQEQAHSFEAMAGYNTVDSTLEADGRADKEAMVATTPEFWQIAGAHAAFGRLFGPADHDVVVLTWRTFQQRFGGDPRAVGRMVRVDGRPATLLGVLPRDFRFLPPVHLADAMTGEAEVFEPNVIGPELRSRRPPILVLAVVGKLRPGVAPAGAQAEVQGIQDRLARANPTGLMHNLYASSELRVTPLAEKLVGESRRTLLLLQAAVGFVLLIACANLGNLLLARATARQREIAIRAAIGAGRGRLLRQFLAEGLTLALCGGAAGVALARAADWGLLRLSPATLPRLADVTMDARVLWFALAISVLAGAVFGLAPMFPIARGSLEGVLKEGGRGASPSGLRLRRLLAAAELALALVLLTGAGLMVRSFARMYTHPPSFEPEKIGMMQVRLGGAAYDDRQAGHDYAQRVVERVSGIPGVETAAVVDAPGSGPIQVEGMTFPPGQAPTVRFRHVSAGYARVVGLALERGRWMADDEPQRVVMVNQALARRVFGRSDPLGQQVRDFGNLYTIVGVVSDVKASRLDADVEPEVLIPYGRSEMFRRMNVLVKSQLPPSALLPEVRETVQAIDPTQPPYGVTTLEEALDESIAPRRFHLLLLGTFAASAVLLALVGIYGVMAYAVTQRTHEIGVRMALGARRGVIVGMVVRQGMLVAGVGIAAGVAAALGLTRLMTSLLFEVKPDDPLTFVLAAAGLAAATLAASWLPARRASRVDPLEALRYE